MKSPYLILFICLFASSAETACGQSDNVIGIWQGPPPVDSEGSAVIEDTIVIDGVRYDGYFFMRRKGTTTLKDVQRRLAPETLGMPAVFLWAASVRPSDHKCFFSEKEVAGIQVFSSDEFASLSDSPVKFNFVDILAHIIDDGRNTVYKQGTDLSEGDKETIALSELQKKYAPETVGFPCIFIYEYNLIGEDFEKCRVPKKRAQSIKVIPSESIRELKDTGYRFYILDVFPWTQKFLNANQY